MHSFKGRESQQCGFLTRLFHPTEEGVLKAKAVLETWIKGMGLEMKPSKTRITHTLQEDQGAIGFDFLGWTVRQFSVVKTHSGKSHQRPLRFTTISKPSKYPYN